MYLGFLRYELDDLLRAGTNAGTACYAVLSVDNCNAVYNADCLELASLDAVAEADASVHAGIRGCEPALSALAGFKALPLKDRLACFASSVTHYLSNFRLSCAGCSAEDLSDLSCYSCSARRALCAGKCLIAYEVGCVVVASGKSASAAVRARQALSDFSYSFINCYMEYLGSEDQES